MAATSIAPGFPDATTSGVPDGTVLTAYTGPTTITKAGTVIEGKIIDGGLVVNAANVTIKNCIIKNGYWFGVDGEKGGSTLLVQNCDIIGTGVEGNSGLLGTGQFIGNDISGYENGIMSTGGSGGVFSGNYIHDLSSQKADPHYTGIQVEGGESNLRIENNTVMNEQDSNIFLQALYGPISNVVINHNWVGGVSSGNNSYNIYVESRFGYPITDVSVTNNYINKGYYGYFSIVNSSPAMSGNVQFDTDHGIMPPSGGSPPTNPPPTAPSAPIIASFSSDSGVVGDKITNDSTLALHGTAAANSAIKIYDGANQIGTATADAAGSWDYITAVLANAAHVLTATATNAGGQTSAKSAQLSVTVDTVAPTAPVLGSNSIVNANQVKLSGTAEANSKVTVFDGAAAVGTATAGSTGAWSFTTNALSNGTHTLTATATDVAGNVSVVSQAVKPVISAPTSPPAATPKIVSFSNDSGTAGDHITNDNTLLLRGTAAANATVKVLDGNAQVGSVKADGSGNWALTTSVLKDGDHHLTATGADAAGTTSAASAALDVRIDTHAPDAPSMGLYSKNGSAVSGATTLDDLIVKGAAEANSKVAIFDSGKQIGTATAGSSGSWSYDTGHLDDGNHSFTARAIDVAGNTSGSSAAKGITVKDAVAPLELTSFSESSNHGVTIKGTGDAFSQIKLFDGAKAIGTVKADGNGDWFYKASGLSDQVHTFKAQEIDSTGHVIATTSGSAILGSSRGNTLNSSAGDDIFIGNGHPDTFVFAANFGRDVIKDLDAYGRSHDTIQFSKSVFSDFASVLNHASQVGQDVVIKTGDDSLTLKNTKLGSLQSHDFHFA